MKNSNQWFKIMVIFYAMSIGTDLFSCMTTFVNDSSTEVRILNKNDEKFIDIPKNKKRRFGSQEQHAHFIIYIRQPKTKMNVFKPEFECQQNECGNDGNVILKFSDIQNNTGNAKFFTIVRYEVPSMVDDLPMIKNATCPGCPAGPAGDME
ncbi:MAG TPA: hypothetical protein VKU36_05650 [Candidatus Babeliales bacterium]|nr:hypothetical protein [Candidatus Babeliales bacterium]